MKINTFILLVSFFMSCTNAKTLQSPLSVDGDFDKQGHRGCRGLMPENTIPAMIKAIDLGATTLEMEVVITKDKKVSQNMMRMVQILAL